MSTLIGGQFTSRDRAEQAIRELVQAGFAPDQISLVASEHRPEGESTIERGHPGHRIAAVGAGFGGALGTLAGGVAAASALGGGPSLPMLGSAPILLAVAGFTAGAVLGGLSGAFVRHGIPRHTATFVEGEIQGDEIVAGVFVQDDDRRARLARSVFDTCGAESITGE